jgi:hypothetical protein
MRKAIDLQFPFKGLDESTAFVRQRGGQNTYTTPGCDNVVGFDPLTGRNRGAARAGTRKYSTDRVSGTSAGQCIAHVVGAPEIPNRVTEDGTLRVTENGVARDLGPGTPAPVGDRTTTILAVAGGNAAVVAGSGVTAVEAGTGAFSPIADVVRAEPFFQDIYLCDGANYKYFDVSANLMANWEATKGTMPQQTFETKTITGATNASPIVVTIAAHGYQTGDQVQILNVNGNTAANGNWLITVLTANTFSLTASVGNGAYTSGGTCIARRIGSRCALIAVWGGRIVLSGLGTDPQNIFMSAVGDAFDWDYGPEVQTVQQAVAGNITSGYGKNSDIVTALIPYTDDILLIGGSRSIRKFMGNPAEGGINVSVTDITGIAFGNAWCQSPEGVIYFFGSRGGVYKMDPGGGVPARLTAITIDERLSDIDLDANIVSLLWDDRAIAVRVYISPKDGSATTHYVWDVRNEAWWPFSYTENEHNPLAVHLLSGGTKAERYVMEYGQDGYIRVVDVDAPSDDGSPISSYVFLGPFEDTMLLDFEATLSEQSGTVAWEARSASSAEQAIKASPRMAGRFKAGRNPTQWPRVAIERGYLRLAGTGPWAMERIKVGMEALGDTATRTMRTNQ